MKGVIGVTGHSIGRNDMNDMDKKVEKGTRVTGHSNGRSDMSDIDDKVERGDKGYLSLYW